MNFFRIKRALSLLSIGCSFMLPNAAHSFDGAFPLATRAGPVTLTGGCIRVVDNGETMDAIVDLGGFTAVAGGSAYLGGFFVSLTPMNPMDLSRACGLTDVTVISQNGADKTYTTEDYIGVVFRGRETTNGPLFEYEIALSGVTNTTLINTRTVVVDDQTPVIAAIANKTANTDAGENTASVAFTTTVTDNDPSYVGTPVFQIGATTITSPHAFPVGVTTVNVTANADAAGNAPVATSFTVTVTDTSPPATPTTSSVTAAPDGTITVSGTAEPGSTVTVTFPDGSTQSVEAGTDGSYTAVSTSSQPSGSVRVATTDAAGNMSETATTSYTDETNPVAPTISSVTAAQDGLVTVSGVAEPGSTVTVTFPDGSSQSVQALNTASSTVALQSAATNGLAPVVARADAGTDNFTATSTTAQPSGLISLAASDPAGNTSEPVTANYVDQVVPAMPTASSVAVAADGTITVSGTAEPGSTVAVTFPDGVTQSVQAGTDGRYEIVSAASQPSGAITVTATDAAGNTSSALSAPVVTDQTSPSVVISGAPESVSFGENFDVTITFDEDVTGLLGSEIVTANASVTALSGSGSIFTATIAPTHSGDVTLRVPAGAAQDAAGNLSEASNIVTVRSNVVTQTQELIATFQQNRANQLISSQPDLIGLLSGTASGGFDVDVTKNRSSFSLASQIVDGVPLSSETNFGSWFRLNGSFSEDGTADTKYVFGAAGAHIAFGENALVGAVLEIDHLDQENGPARIEGTGWLVGPYVVAKLPDHPLFFESRLLFGQSTNEISPFGTYSDDFDTNRWLGTVKVAGQVEYQGVQFTPSLSGSYTTDEQEAYIDSVGNAIPSQDVTLIQVSPGLDFALPISVGVGQLTLKGGVSGIWSRSSGSGVAANVVPEFEGWRSRVQAGIDYNVSPDIAITAGGYYDGVGSEDFSGYGLDIGLKLAF